MHVQSVVGQHQPRADGHAKVAPVGRLGGPVEEDSIARVQPVAILQIK